ncbi:MAG TPA: phosphatase PAP2 family protein [Phycisphaerae bacterium]|jgi:undecaprenyl-diphosphatase|nr:phosphatase PAP2 family protein [Phycisphaerae bacterium]
MQDIMLIGSLPGILHACASLDTHVAQWLRAHLTPGSADALLAVTTLGSEWWVTSILLLTLGFLAWRRHWHKCAALLLTVPCGTLLGELLKDIVQRPRPFMSGPFGEWGGYSFPSGHTLAATLLYGFLLVLLVPLAQRKRWRLALLSGGSLVILAVAFSRVALGAHYMSDVAVAMIFGGVWVILCWRISRTFRRTATVTIPVSRQNVSSTTE